MPNPKIAPYGSWHSPIEARLLASAGISLGTPKFEGDALYWLEGRPLEKGRVAIVRRTSDGDISDVFSPEFNARTTVHEYGGGAYFVHGATIYFSNFADQRLYQIKPGEQPVAITPQPSERWGLRYADGRVSPNGKWIICVRQRHHDELNADNDLVILPADGSGEPRVIAQGYDFYSSPRFNPDGNKLVWLSWEHPNMPWDGTELWMANFNSETGSLGRPWRVAGGPLESVAQPQWSPDGKLYFISDRTGWWNLYCFAGGARALCPMEAEFCGPQWTFGASDYVFLPESDESGCYAIACLFSQNGIDHVGILSSRSGNMQTDCRLRTIEIGYTALSWLTSDGERLYLVGANAAQGYSLLAVEPYTGVVKVIRKSSSLTVDPGYISTPKPIEFPTENDLTAHALFYPPTNQDFAAPDGEKPPLLVISHGGPTAATSAAFSLSIQYWTSRGFGVVDVNYGGSTGYGRAYRERLNGTWGVVDVQDCINAAKYLIAQGLVDPKRVAVRGGSAGGYTTLVALTQYDFFSAGASYYGIADLEPFATDTHKFESRYLDRLIGPYPEAKELYQQRSPIHFVDQISCPMILLQGLEDKVVPPSQAEIMVRALEAKGLPYAYLPFEGEQHGFRKAETIQRAAEAEFYFYSKVFGFELAEAVEPVEIKNLP
jgi:dipeptidyl aminopeptidase/acylaminoacyl peptidase